MNVAEQASKSAWHDVTITEKLSTQNVRKKAESSFKKEGLPKGLRKDYINFYVNEYFRAIEHYLI